MSEAEFGYAMVAFVSGALFGAELVFWGLYPMIRGVA